MSTWPMGVHPCRQKFLWAVGLAAKTARTQKATQAPKMSRLKRTAALCLALRLEWAAILSEWPCPQRPSSNPIFHHP